MRATRIYLIDDHHVLRQAIATMLETEGGMEVIGQSGEAQSAIGEIADRQPEIVIVDLKMPGMGGLAAIGEIARVAPRTGIIVFTMYDNPAYV